jgi:uncharacterized protein (TIGR00297 family)
VDALLTSETLTAVAVTTAFAGGAWLLRGVTFGGALAGFVVAFTLFFTTGPGGFVVLIAVFAVAWLTTRLGYRRKQALGTAEDARGRSAAQVLANLGGGVLFAIGATATEHRILLLAAMAALAEAAADTAASECGQALSDRAYLITSFREVPPGINGGVSARGSIAAVVAAVMVGAVAVAGHVVPWRALPVVAGAGLLGTMIDSLLGATLENRGVIGNNGVNVASTLAAGMIALLIAR